MLALSVFYEFRYDIFKIVAVANIEIAPYFKI